ncbi:SAM-dependent methyltransferase [Putridiphycobacter roseus]|uniref:SAM-dependent methyltransferase n=1 Tax=Putridiphycobacter roseus TaxID=2219161 RepID=A0A2W1NLV1_9FLAO|nr:class I SAM-dependent methyltransferase [Putridiphycobacter roseus]PZE15708.1 SAM-dependent methyltransferase [Putridiphycobacter roseus]
MFFKQLQFLLQSLIESPKGLNENEIKIISIIESIKGSKNASDIHNRYLTLLENKQYIEVIDLGTGRNNGNRLRRVSDIVKTASILPKYGLLYQSLIKQFNFESAIELGTNFGLGTSYLAKCVDRVLTIEGCPNIAKIAKDTFQTLNLHNITLTVGAFDENLDKTMPYLDKPCLVYIDGNHTYEATLRYYQFFKENAKDGSILVFDDIYWSAGMLQFWKEIEKDPFICIDLRRVGIVQLLPTGKQKAIKRIF